MTTDLDISIFWDDSADLWDTVFLGAEPLPGIARVTGSHGRKLDVKSPPGRNGATITDKGYQPAKVEITLKLWEKAQLEAWFRIAPTLTYRREPPVRGTSSTSTSKSRAARDNARALAQANETRDRLVELSNSGIADDNLQKEVNAIEAEDRLRTQRSSARGRALERHDFEISHPALDTIQVHRVYIEEVGIPTPTSTPGVYEVKIKAIESRAPSTGSTRSVRGGTTAGQSFATGIRTAFDARGPSGSGGAGP
jgi:hypothetical protein